MCPGNPDAKFVAICQSRNGIVEAADGTVKAAVDSYYPVKLNSQEYVATIRTASCDLLVRGSKCASCKKYRAVLRALWSKSKKHTSQSTHTCSHTNYRYLNTLQMKERMSGLKMEVVKQRREVSQLKARIREMTEQSGVQVDNRLQEDLEAIMREMTEQVCEDYREDSFRRVFWEHNSMPWKQEIADSFNGILYLLSGVSILS